MSVELLQELASPDVKPQPVVKNTTFIEEFPTLRVVKPSSGRAEFSEEDNQFIYLVNAKLVDQAEAVFEVFLFFSSSISSNLIDGESYNI